MAHFVKKKWPQLKIRINSWFNFCTVQNVVGIDDQLR